MANSKSTNPLIVDTAGAVFHGGSGETINITSIVVNASADTWSVILKDGSGNVIFRATQPLVNDRFKTWSPAKPLPVNGIYADTLTNITNVLIYTER